MAKVMCGSTIPAYKAADHSAESISWLATAEEMISTSKSAGHEVGFFATLEVDARGLEPFQEVIDYLLRVQGLWWKFSVDLGDEIIDGSTRLPRICMGRNLLIEAALMEPAISHILFLDSDTEVPADSVVRLLALERPLAGGHVPVYCLRGPVVQAPNVQEHWNTAGFLMVERKVFSHVRWGIDPDGGNTDDPHFALCAELMGFGKTWVDHDLIARHRPHKPGGLAPVHLRGHDLKIYR